MAEQRHITPSIALVAQWIADFEGQTTDPSRRDLSLALDAAQWGADQELEACCAFAQNQAWGLVNGPHVADVIRAARRPKPPSLKQQALEAAHIELIKGGKNAKLIIRALEALPDDQN